MEYFTDKDELWQQAAQAIDTQQAESEGAILAPAEFLDLFTRVIDYSLVSRFRADFFDLVLVHKGMCKHLGGLNLEHWIDHYHVVFANPVFVLFASTGKDLVDRKSDHVESLLKNISMLSDLPLNLHSTPQNNNAPFETVLGDEVLDLRPIVACLDKVYMPGEHLLVGPIQLKSVYTNLLTMQDVLHTTIGSTDLVVLTVNSVLEFPFADLQHVISSQYEALYNDPLIAVFARSSIASQSPNSKTKKSEVGLADVIRTAMNDQDYLFTLADYRETVIRKLPEATHE